MTRLPIFVAALLVHTGGSFPQRGQMENRGVAVRALLEAGLSAEVLAAAGVTAGEVEAAIDAAAESAGERAAFDAAHQSRAAALAAVRVAVEAARSDPSSEQARQALADASNALASAKQVLEQSRAALLALAAAEFSPACASRLSACREVAARKIPPAMRAASLSAAEWEAVELAIIAERRAVRLDGPVPTDAAELLSSVRAQAAVVTAQQAVDVSLASIEAVLRSDAQ